MKYEWLDEYLLSFKGAHKGLQGGMELDEIPYPRQDVRRVLL